MGSLKYRAEVDGLRSFAVLAVIIFHLRCKWFPGGFLGVDVFFVISGYLITSIILRDLDRGKFRFRDFWARRIRRIQPALLVLISAALTATLMLGFKGLRPETGRQGLAALFSVANIYFQRQMGDYWGPRAESAPFLHTWSLAVEEQFYLFLPLALWFLHRRSRRCAFWAILGVAAVSLALFLVRYSSHGSSTFYLLPTRLWELAAGALLAWLPPKRDERWLTSGVGGVVGLGLIVLSYFLVPGIGPGVILAVLGTTLVLVYGGTGPCRRLLASAPLVYVGKISYSLYLWHWPVLVLLPQLELTLPVWLSVPVMFALAIASYQFVEVPTRSSRRTVPLALASLASLAIVALVAASMSGTYDISRFNKISYYGYYFDLKPEGFQGTRLQGARAAMDLPARQVGAEAYTTGGIIVGAAVVPDVVLLGDSHGGMWSHTVQLAVESTGLTGSLYSMDGITPFFRVPPSQNQVFWLLSSEVKYRFDKARIEHIQAWKPKIVLIATRWSELKDVELARASIEFLHYHAGTVLLIGQPPELGFGERLAAEHLCFKGIWPQEARDVYLPVQRKEETDHGNRIAQEFAQAYDNVVYVPTEDIYLRGSTVLVLRGGNVVYLDGNHLTEFGAGLAADRVRAAIRDASTKKAQSGAL